MIKIMNLKVVANQKTPFEKTIIENINCEFPKNKVTLLVGASGAGKSTIINSITKTVPYKGDILIDNINTKKIKNHEFHKMIGYAMQNPEKQIFTTTIYDEINYAHKNIIGQDMSKEQVQEKLKKSGLNHIDIEKAPRSLSGGEKRKISILASTSHNPEILIFDEPLASLDNPSKKQHLQMLSKIENKTVIIITHNIVEFKNIADKIIFITDDKKIIQGPYAEILKNEAMQEYYND